jgi:hypothetical protein
LLPSQAKTNRINHRVIKDKTEMEKKWLEEHGNAVKLPKLATNELPSAPKNG